MTLALIITLRAAPHWRLLLPCKAAVEQSAQLSPLQAVDLLLLNLSTAPEWSLYLRRQRAAPQFSPAAPVRARERNRLTTTMAPYSTALEPQGVELGASPCVAARWLRPAAPDADPARARRLLRLRAPIKLFRHPTTSSIIPHSIQTTTSNLLMTKFLATTLPAPRLHTPQTVPGATLGLPRHPRLGCLATATGTSTTWSRLIPHSQLGDPDSRLGTTVRSQLTGPSAANVLWGSSKRPTTLTSVGVVASSHLMLSSAAPIPRRLLRRLATTAWPPTVAVPRKTPPRGGVAHRRLQLHVPAAPTLQLPSLTTASLLSPPTRTQHCILHPLLHGGAQIHQPRGGDDHRRRPRAPQQSHQPLGVEARPHSPTGRAAMPRLGTRRWTTTIPALSPLPALDGDVHRRLTIATLLPPSTRGGAVLRRPCPGHAQATPIQPWHTMMTMMTLFTIPPPRLVARAHTSPGLRLLRMEPRPTLALAGRAPGRAIDSLPRPHSSHCVPHKDCPCQISISTTSYDMLTHIGQKTWTRLPRRRTALH